MFDTQMFSLQEEIIDLLQTILKVNETLRKCDSSI